MKFYLRWTEKNAETSEECNHKVIFNGHSSDFVARIKALEEAGAYNVEGESLTDNQADRIMYERNDVIYERPESKLSKFGKSQRIKQLKAMHELMLLANDEDIYMTWIYTMPDEPQEDDFEYIAENDELYNEIFDCFVRLIKNKDCRY